MKDFRTPEAKKWVEDYIPPETCAAIDDLQNALEHLRDTNSQLRHAAYYWKRIADQKLEYLTAGLKRLASVEAFTFGGVRRRAQDDELIARVNFARELLAQKAAPAQPEDMGERATISLPRIVHDTRDAALIELIGRIVDPDAWAYFDGDAGQHFDKDLARFDAWKASAQRKARAIIAALANSYPQDMGERG